MPNSNIVASWLTLAVTPLVAGMIAWLAVLLLGRALRLRLKTEPLRWARIHQPSILTAASLAVYFILPVTGHISDRVAGVISHAMAVVAIMGTGWLILALTDTLSATVIRKWDIHNKTDNRKERALLTKFRMMRRIWVGLVVICMVGAVLMTFPSIRSLGAGMLASAGVAGIILGIALRPTVETLLAGVQIALTEPINIDDVVIVEGEWGRIEQIKLTYVVVRIWDDRRLIVPLSYFISQPFENWTRKRADITGIVTLEVDFMTPVEEVRKEVGRIVEQDEDFDGRLWNLQVTEAKEQTMTLRVLCTAANADKAWNLRCRVREKLVTWLQHHHPDCLPRLRAQIRQSA